ncbi:MAG: F0F1 ATP synthase subunit B [Planctomycetaceae bacterium]|jgi:F-type H+-transporting ATPase subunit b|nr:F0F1 ATP synthase subunit B [Planctomycetaceae bacterium]
MTLKRIIPVVFVLLLCAISVGSVLAASEHAAEHVAGDPLAYDGPKRDLALWSLVIFLILFGILYKFAFAPIAKALDSREQGIAENIAAAERANSDAKELLTQYQKKLDDADGEVRQIVDDAKADGRRMADGIVEQARKAADSQQKRAIAEIDAATTNALQELAEKSASLAAGLAGRIIRKEIDVNAHRDLVNEAISNLKN